MKHIKEILFLISLAVILPVEVYADCASDFKEVEKDFKVSYEYNKDTDDFTITMISPDYERYGFYCDDKAAIAKMQNRISGKKMIVTIPNYKNSEFMYGIVPSYGECFGKTVLVKTISLVTYNPYADNPKCQGNEDFVLCQKDYNEDIEEDEFNSRIETYEKTKEQEEEIPSDSKITPSEGKDTKEKVTIKNLFNKIVDYIVEHKVETIIIGVLVIALIIGIIIYVRKVIKSRRFE